MKNLFFAALHDSHFNWNDGALDNEQDYVTAALAKMAFKDYFGPSTRSGLVHDVGDRLRSEVNASILTQSAGKVGTSIDPPGRHYDISDYDRLLIDANFDYEWHAEYDVLLIAQWTARNLL